MNKDPVGYRMKRGCVLLFAALALTFGTCSIMIHGADDEDSGCGWLPVQEISELGSTDCFIVQSGYVAFTGCPACVVETWIVGRWRRPAIACPDFNATGRIVMIGGASVIRIVNFAGPVSVTQVIEIYEPVPCGNTLFWAGYTRCSCPTPAGGFGGVTVPPQSLGVFLGECHECPAEDYVFEN